MCLELKSWRFMWVTERHAERNTDHRCQTVRSTSLHRSGTSLLQYRYLVPPKGRLDRESSTEYRIQYITMYLQYNFIVQVTVKPSSKFLQFVQVYSEKDFSPKLALEIFESLHKCHANVALASCYFLCISGASVELERKFINRLS